MNDSNLQNVKIGFIGAGNMAKAIGGGLVKNGIVEASRIFVTAPSCTSFEFWNKLGAQWVKSNSEICSSCDIIFLAMKPQTLLTAVQQMDIPRVGFQGKLLVSLLAGATVQSLETALLGQEELNSRQLAVIRVMPNTPMQVGHGCSVFCGNSHVQPKDIKRMSLILGSLGKTFEVKEELIDAISSISGNGPAYMFMIIEAMSDIGVKMGIPRDLAIQLAAQTMVGSGQMVLQSGRHPGVLKDEVCSPGGSTIAGLHVLERNGVRAAIMDTLEAAAAKNKELGKLASES